jgi:hypothetical protein
LAAAQVIQQNLLWRANIPKQKALMAAVDRLNGKHWREKVRIAREVLYLLFWVYGIFPN